VLPIALENISLFDILRLQGFKNGWKYKVLKDYGQNKLVKHYYDTFGTTAYFVKPASAKILLEKSNRFHAPVDVFFSHDWIHRLNILSIFPYPIKPSGLPSTIACYKKRKNKLSLKKKWLTKIYKIPRSVAKRFYRMKTFPMLFFTKIKQRDEDTSGCISPRSVVE
jgi:GR25 family glycosyltransferase involved in LPS biosynthesis